MVMGEQTRETELLIIGGGPGGYAAAFRAADLGLQVTLVSDEPRLGGVCLHRGCIPSKALLEVAKLLERTEQAAAWGLTFDKPEIDPSQIRAWKDKVVDQLVHGLAKLGARRDINVIEARATFDSAHEVRLQGAEVDRIHFDQAIIATGSHPLSLPDVSFSQHERVWDAAEALDLPEIPQRLLIVGGGYIGLEMGTVYAALGSEVTLVEMTDGLLPGVDRDLVRPLAKQAEKLFANLYFNTKVTDLTEKEDGVYVHFEGERTDEQPFDRVLVAIGREPTTAELGLENTAVEQDERGFIQTDIYQQTAEKGIFAIGDVAGEPLLAHKAMYEGKIAAEVVAGQAAAFDARAIPAVVYTHPEIAWCGLTEQEARDQELEVKISRFPWSASGRAQTMGEPIGLTKIIFDSHTERILGMGIVGEGAAELIAEGALAVEMGALAQDLVLTIHPHPTLTETVGEAAEAFLGAATHIFSDTAKSTPQQT